MNRPKHQSPQHHTAPSPLIVIAAVFVVACALVLGLTATGTLQPLVAKVTGVTTPAGQTGGQAAAKKPSPKQFADYSWDELAAISAEIAAAPDDEGGRQIAASYNLADSNGIPMGGTRELVLSDRTLAYVRIVGFRHDPRSDDGTNCGITLMASMISEQPMNEKNSSKGGWKSSTLRAWLSGDGRALLPEELARHIVPVDKPTNNVGETSDISAVTTTSDGLWLFSAKEVCGPVSWFVDEFATEISSTADYDALINAEGSQYEYFAANGVTQSSGGAGTLALTYRGASRSWWYRTPYPLNYLDLNPNGYFYRASEAGLPSSVGMATDQSGVVVGFCI